MYTNFFGFTEKPFDVTPDPRFLYLSPEHRETLATLMYGIQERRGFITIVGEVGTGKTTLLNTVLDLLDERTKVAYVFNSDVTAEQLITSILVELRLAKTDGTLYKGQAIDRLNHFAIEQLGNDGNVVLIVDEAQNLGHRAMENLRLLSNLETHKLKLIQIILSGQPELDAKLNDPELRQLAQRISLKRYITPLSEAETYEYIQHRLAIAGYEGASLFDRKAQQIIWQYSGGIPRKINILCDNAFLIAYGLKRRKIKDDVMAEAIKDLTWSPFSIDAYTSQLRKRAFVLTLAKAACIILAAGMLFAIGFQIGRKDFHPQAGSDAISRNAVRARIGPQPSGPDEATFAQATPGSILPLVETARAETTPVDTAVGSLKESGVSSSPTVFTSLPEKAVEGSKSTQPESVKAGQTSPETSSQPKAPARSATAGDAPVKSVDRPNRVAVVKPGDTLNGIILGTYGEYSEALLKTVLAQNPDISKPDQIFVGQVIKLPEIRGQSKEQ